MIVVIWVVLPAVTCSFLRSDGIFNQPNLVMCNGLLSARETAGQWQRALTILAEMAEKWRLQPDLISYVTAMTAINGQDGDNWEVALQLLHCMGEIRWRPEGGLKGVSFVAFDLQEARKKRKVLKPNFRLEINQHCELKFPQFFWHQLPQKILSSPTSKGQPGLTQRRPQRLCPRPPVALGAAAPAAAPCPRRD